MSGLGSVPLPAAAHRSGLSAVRPAGGTPRAGDGFADSAAIAVALERAFGRDSVLSIAYRPVVLDSASLAEISMATRSPFADDTLRAYVCRRGNRLAGYGIVDNVNGKSRDITYLLALTPEGEVASVEILVYRESHGGEIAAPAFRNQFRGKRPGDPLAPGRDIQTISGATISSRSVTAGVAKLLAAFDRVKGRI
jgi:hypothetical protein